MPFIIIKNEKVEHCTYECFCDKSKCSYSNSSYSCKTHNFLGNAYDIHGEDMKIYEEI